MDLNPKMIYFSKLKKLHMSKSFILSLLLLQV